MKFAKRLFTALICVVLVGGVLPTAFTAEEETGTPLSHGAPVFFDDFTTDLLFWNIDIGNMRRYNNRLISNYGGWSRAETRGRLWDNFTAIIDFTFTSPHQPAVDDFAVFHVRYQAADNNVAVMIRDNRISVMFNWDFTEHHVAHHDFTRDEIHRLKIEAYNEFINLFIWCSTANDFVQLNTYPIIHGIAGQLPQVGQMVLRSWLCDIAVDSVRIIDTNAQAFFFADSFVRVELGAATPQIISPENNTGAEIQSISFSSSDPAIISVDAATGAVTAHRQYTDVVQITATATMSNGEIFTAQYDAVVYAPFTGEFSFILHPTHPNHPQILRVGDTMNLNLFTRPVYVSDIQFAWTTTHPHAMQFVGDTAISRGIRALTPANDITVRATHYLTGLYTETTFDILPRITSTVDRTFTIDSTAREIPSHFWGVNLGYSVGFINGYFHARDGNLNVLNQIQDKELEFLRSIQPQSVRFILEHYNSVNVEGEIVGTHIQNSDAHGFSDPVPLRQVFRQVNELGVPLFFTTSTHNTPAHKVELISAALNIADARPLIVTIMNEPHDPNMDTGHMIGRNPPATVQEYMAVVRYVSTAIRKMYPNEDIIISVCTNPDAQMWANPADIYTPGTLAHRLVGWNEYLALPQNQYYFDAVAMFSYSGASGSAHFGGITTDSIMESFSIHSARELEILNRQRTLFPDKQLWFVEFGDLPIFHFHHAVHNYFPMCNIIRARWQYTKSVGNAIGYVQRQLRILNHGVATMYIYYSFNHADSFGVVQTNWDAPYGGHYEFIALPRYYSLRQCRQ